MSPHPLPSDGDAVSRRYQSLLAVTESISAHTNISELFKELPGQLRPVVNFDAVAVVLAEPEHNRMRLQVFETSIPLTNVPVTGDGGPIEVSPEGIVWQTQKPMLISSVRAETRFPEYMARIRAENINTLYSIPLTSSGRRLGAIAFGSVRENAYGDQDLEFLRQVAKQVAIAIDNVRNLESAAGERDRNQLLLDVNNAVASNLDLRQLLSAISVCLGSVIPHDATGLAVYDEQIKQLRMHAVQARSPAQVAEGRPIPMEGTPAGLAFTTRKTVLRERTDFQEFNAPFFKQMIQALGLRCGVSVPLIFHDQPIGVLSLSSYREAAFDQSDATLLEQISSQLAIAVQNTLNFERAKRERERAQTLLEINNAIATSLNLRDLLGSTSACLRNYFNHDVAGLALHDESTKRLMVHAMDRSDQNLFVKEGAVLSLEGTPMAEAFTLRRRVLVKNFTLKQFPTPEAKAAYAAGWKSGVHVPLVAHDRTLGVLGLASFREDAFTELDADLLESIAGQVALAVENSLQFRQIELLTNKLASEKLYLEEEIKTQYNFAEIIGQSRVLKEILQQVETVAPTDSTVLLIGETGTGKELFARAIHDLSGRKERTLVKLNCAAIPTGLLESELFGHEKGAFTGAIAQRVGRFELANKGTLLLDEIGEIPLELQPKLLRVLQEHEFERLGSSRTIRTDARLIAATNCDLEQMVSEKKFRSDLFYRLNVFPVMIPPLRERSGDIPLLVSYFTQKHSARMNKQIKTIPNQTMNALCSYHWPGNVRELENFVERSIILSRGAELQAPLAELEMDEAIPTTGEGQVKRQKFTTMEEMERAYIAEVLQQTKGSVGGKGGAAEILGLPASTLRSRMKKLGLK